MPPSNSVQISKGSLEQTRNTKFRYMRTMSFCMFLTPSQVLAVSSGYKLNLDKNELLPITKAPCQLSLRLLPFKVIDNKFNCLGVCITKSHFQPSKANFISIIKMNILPKCLFLFQCIPYFLTKIFFTKHSLISSFIWNNVNNDVPAKT